MNLAKVVKVTSGWTEALVCASGARLTPNELRCIHCRPVSMESRLLEALATRLSVLVS